MKWIKKLGNPIIGYAHQDGQEPNPNLLVSKIANVGTQNSDEIQINRFETLKILYEAMKNHNQ